jgi:hypothetical protein
MARLITAAVTPKAMPAAPIQDQRVIRAPATAKTAHGTTYGTHVAVYDTSAVKEMRTSGRGSNRWSSRIPSPAPAAASGMKRAFSLVMSYAS